MSSPPRNSRFSKKSTRAPRASEGRFAPSSRLNSASKPDKNRSRSPKSGKATSNDWIWGTHAALAALKNPSRTIHEVLVTPAASQRLNLPDGLNAQITDPSALDRKFNESAHQGLAVRASAPRDVSIEDLATPASGLIIVLDQVTDPHNVGAIFRLCAAFGARGLIMQDRKAPPLSGATAKVAVGCVETVAHALVSNIGNTLLSLRDMGWIVTGLAGESDMDIARAVALPKNADAPANVIVMGAEGPGLRPRVRDCCDHLARIPMPGGAESLNVSTAAAVAMYETIRGST